MRFGYAVPRQQQTNKNGDITCHLTSKRQLPPISMAWAQNRANLVDSHSSNEHLARNCYRRPDQTLKNSHLLTTAYTGETALR